MEFELELKGPFWVEISSNVTSNLDKKYDNDEEDHANVFSNQPFYDEYDEDIEVLDRKFHDQ